MRVSANGAFVFVDYMIIAVKDSIRKLLLCSYFERSEIAMRSFSANIDLTDLYIYQKLSDGTSDILQVPKAMIKTYTTSLMNGKETIHHGISINEEINDTYLITTKDKMQEDVYDYFMDKFKLPLLEEWLPYLMKKAPKQFQVIEKEIYGRIPNHIEDMIILEISMTEALLSKLISDGLKEGSIFFTKEKQNPLRFNDLDEYIGTYGHTLIENLKNRLKPLTPNKDTVDEVAFLNKRFYPQQATIVNGVTESLNEKNYSFINEDMGCGKVRRCGAIKECA